MKSNNFGTFWTDSEISILEKNYLSDSVEQIMVRLPNRSKGSIQRKASFLGLTDFKKKQHQSQKRYEINQEFFDSPAVKNSYWAGFIAADGHLSKDNGLRISLSSKDESIVHNFVDHVGYDGKTRRHNGCSLDHEYITVDIWGVERWHNCLAKNWNIPRRRKTLTIGPPKNLSYKNSLAYIWGLIDGDGWVSKKGYLGFCGTRPLVLWVRNILGDIPKNRVNIRTNGGSQVNYRCQWAKRDTESIIEELKLVTEIDWGLKRKIG